MKKMILFIGPSSSGKDTFLAKALKIYDIEPIVLLTTRPPRIGEQNGCEYYFITQEEMNDLEKKQLLIERRDYNTIQGICSYATSAEKINLEKYNYLTPNTWVGYQKILNYFEPKLIVPVYFELEAGVRLERALERERKKDQNYLEMCRRFLADQKDFTKEMLNTYKPYIIDNNGTVEETMKQLDELFVNKLEIVRKR